MNLLEKKMITNIDRIVTDPEVCGGKPRIKGTRIQAALILEILESGGTIEEILENYPHLKKEDILACISFARQVVEGAYTRTGIPTKT